ncbi:MAG: hypothetical protein QW403_03190 [Candidatus Aenigmatarchaeota archaeon]
MKWLILVIGIVLILLISGSYVYLLKPQLITPPLKIPPKVPLSLNAYGKLTDFSQNELITLKIQPEIINWELNTTQLTIEVNKTAFREFYREITDYTEKTFNYSEENVATRMWYSHENYYIYDINKLEPKTFYYFKFKVYTREGNIFTDGVFGQFVSFNKDENSIKIYALWNNWEGLDTIYLTTTGKYEWVKVNETFVARNREFISAQRPWRLSDLVIGNNYAFYFTKISEEKGPWDRISISENLTEYKQNGAWKHENDLTIDQMTITEGGEGESQPGQMRIVRIFPTSIIPNEETELKIRLINNQDVDIPYTISNVKIVDELVWEPNLRQCQENEPEYQEITIPGPAGQESRKVLAKVCSNKSSEQRLQESILSNCQINYDSSENIISANSSKIISFKVLCKEPVSCKSWYISETYGNVTTECRLILLGNLKFTDELGNVHKRDNVYLKQFLTLSEKLH